MPMTRLDALRVSALRASWRQYKVVPESVNVSDAAMETLQRTFNDAIDNMIPKMPNLADMSDQLNDLQLHETRKAKTNRASSRVTA
ncbi:unnamed protein product [Prunus armeniaca]|uniref:Uncharacterized protein n=1 Tax=Prunus armeniaca TaxID=36596 RepID=A0A6J5TTG3_PRUAR|nr:unnamed protein product [Prunus armeniaca]